jgi:hypothetical protein
MAGRSTYGLARVHKANKRREAEKRNAETPLERTKQYRVIDHVLSGKWCGHDMSDINDETEHFAYCEHGAA